MYPMRGISTAVGGSGSGNDRAMPVYLHKKGAMLTALAGGTSRTSGKTRGCARHDLGERLWHISASEGATGTWKTRKRAASSGFSSLSLAPSSRLPRCFIPSPTPSSACGLAAQKCFRLRGRPDAGTTGTKLVQNLESPARSVGIPL